MKEATGELSTTVIAIVAIAAILVIFTVFLLPTLRAQIALTQACNNGPSYKVENADGSTVTCKAASGTGTKKSWQCEYKASTDDGGKTSTKMCMSKN